jgi:hypothetical protein
MKKVRFAIGTAGVAGLAPVAGLLMPSAPAAAATGHVAKPTAKTVSAVPLRPDAGCTGTVKDSAISSGSTVFWYTEHTNSTCIGTVKKYGGNSLFVAYRVRVYGSAPHNSGLDYSNSWPHHLALGATHSWGVHENFANKVKVCMSIKDSEGQWFKSCTTVP